MRPEPSFTLRLAKQDFQFAAAHFTLFPDGSGELLHGHNFRVRVELRGPRTGPMGLLVDVAAVKEQIRTLCRRLDERTLIPEKAALLRLRSEGDSTEVRFDDRCYRLPLRDVALLPLENVTVELLARLLWEELAPALADSPVERLMVEVEETRGQSAAYTAPLPAGG